MKKEEQASGVTDYPGDGLATKGSLKYAQPCEKNEDLIVASLNALSDGKSSAGTEGVMTCIADPRWRVRVAALEYAGKLKIQKAKDAVLTAFKDKDEFVRRRHESRCGYGAG